MSLIVISSVTAQALMSLDESRGGGVSRCLARTIRVSLINSVSYGAPLINALWRGFPASWAPRHAPVGMRTFQLGYGLGTHG